MKVFAINPLQFNKTKLRSNFENNQYDYSQNRLSVLNCRQQDTVSFNGKIPSLVTPTMEDLINKTKAVDVLRSNILRLAKYKIPCPCCGHIMLDIDKFNKFEDKVLQTTNPKELLALIDGLKQYLHPVESRIFTMMKRLSNEHPDMTLHEMLRGKLKKSEKKLIFEQSKTLVSLGLMSRKLPEDKGKAVKLLISETYNRLFDQRETSRFSRKIFITKLEDILKDSDNDKLKSEFIGCAAKLPTAYNNPDAFIVKYAKRNYKGANPDQKIALRMLSNSLATTEHIKPRKKGGDISPENLALECACCNNKRNHDSLLEQILQNPGMILNYKNYMKRLSELHQQKILEKSYITRTNKTYNEGSNGLLNAEEVMKELSIPKQKQRKNEKSGITPTLEERRAARKEKLKNKKLHSGKNS